MTPKPKPRPKTEIPPTLANVPVSDIEDTSRAGKYDHLDKLDGEAFETALAKLPEAEQDAYLASR